MRSINISATPFERLEMVDLGIGLRTIIPNDLVDKMLSQRSSTVLRADRHTTTPPGTELTAPLEFGLCRSCVTPGPKSVAKRQRRLESTSRDEQRVKDAADLIARIEAFQAIYSNRTSLAEPQPLETQPIRQQSTAGGPPYGRASNLPVHVNDACAECICHRSTCPSRQETVKDGEECVETNRTTIRRLREQPDTCRLNLPVVRSCELCCLIVDKSVLLTPEPQVEEIAEPESFDFDDLPNEGDTKSDNDLPGPEQMFGSESLQASVSQLCTKYKDIYSANVKVDPARVRPFDI